MDRWEQWSNRCAMMGFYKRVIFHVCVGRVSERRPFQTSGTWLRCGEREDKRTIKLCINNQSQHRVNEKLRNVSHKYVHNVDNVIMHFVQFLLNSFCMYLCSDCMISVYINIWPTSPVTCIYLIYLTGYIFVQCIRLFFIFLFFFCVF